jgi:hypothetical protein
LRLAGQPVFGNSLNRSSADGSRNHMPLPIEIFLPRMKKFRLMFSRLPVASISDLGAARNALAVCRAQLLASALFITKPVMFSQGQDYTVQHIVIMKKLWEII